MALKGLETWKGIDSKVTKIGIVFETDDFVANSSDKSKNSNIHRIRLVLKFSYNLWYKIDDGRGYKIYFLNSKDETIVFIRDENGILIYTISRNDYKSYEDLYSLE